MSPLLGAAGVALVWGAVTAVHRRRVRRRRRRGKSGSSAGDDASLLGYTGDACVAGIRRARRHRVVLRGRVGEDGDALDPLPLDVCIAAPPAALRGQLNPTHPTRKAAKGLREDDVIAVDDDDEDEGDGDEDDDDDDDAVVVLYVLDPEPILFGAATLFAFAQAAYGSTPGTVESVFRRMYVVGVGHAASSFALDGSGLDTARLRQIRRRDFPPRDHPTVKPGRGVNAAATRFVDGVVHEVIPFVEHRVLRLHRSSAATDAAAGPPGRRGAAERETKRGRRKRRVRRAVMGASFSAVAALQMMIRHPGVFADFVMGSPSVVFDPEVLDDLVSAKGKVKRGMDGEEEEEEGETGVLVLLGDKEHEVGTDAGRVLFCLRAYPRDGKRKSEPPAAARDD